MSRMDTASNANQALQDSRKSLADRIRRGDGAAEEELVNAYRRGILAIATARVRDRDAALDLTQEVLMATLRALREGHLREPEKLPAFIQGTARNIINNFLRTRVRRSECPLDEQLPGADPVKELESAERQRLLRREVESYSPTDQQILLWSLVDGHSLSEVARRLKMSHEAVRARKSRLIRKIARKFSEMSQK
jgi:RNA polymerase sigma factor (sigma-70 family)